LEAGNWGVNLEAGEIGKGTETGESEKRVTGKFFQESGSHKNRTKKMSVVEEWP
jgi:hypothetical protein